MNIEDVRKQDYELIVVHSTHSFLGMVDAGFGIDFTARNNRVAIGVVDQRIDEGHYITLLNAFPIAPTQGPRGPGGPGLGTLHWLVLEGVPKLRIKPQWHYWVSETSERSQKEFYNVYIKHQENMEEMKFFQSITESGLVMASPADLLRAEAVAKKLGFPSLQEAMSAIKGPTPQQQ